MLSRSQLAFLTAVSVLRHAKNSLFCIPNMETTVFSVVSSPFGNRHSSFSPTMFFEISVYSYLDGRSVIEQCQMKSSECILVYLEGTHLYINVFLAD